MNVNKDYAALLRLLQEESGGSIEVQKLLSQARGNPQAQKQLRNYLIELGGGLGISEGVRRGGVFGGINRRAMGDGFRQGLDKAVYGDAVRRANWRQIRPQTFGDALALSRADDAVGFGPVKVRGWKPGPANVLFGKNAVPRIQGLAGLGTILAIADGMSELGDTADPRWVNSLEAGGKIGGTIGGTALGGFLGSLVLPGIGTFAGATLGSMLGGGMGKQAGRGIAYGFNPDLEQDRRVKLANQQRELDNIQNAELRQRIDQLMAQQEMAQMAGLASNFANSSALVASNI